MAFSIRFSASRMSSSRSPGAIGGLGRVQTNLRAAFGGERRKRLDHVPDDGDEIDAALRAQVLRLLDARQRQQIIDEARHAQRLLAHDGEKLHARSRIFARRALQRLDEAHERGERRAQFVAGVGDEIGAHALGAHRLGQVGHRDGDGERAIERDAGDAHVEDLLDRHALEPAHGFGSPPAHTRRTASSTCGARSPIGRGSPGCNAGKSARAAVLAASMRIARVDEKNGAGHRLRERRQAALLIVGDGAIARPWRAQPRPRNGCVDGQDGRLQQIGLVGQARP